MDSSKNPEKPRAAVMGAGAVGSYFGGMLARAGVDVTFIARPAHAGAIHRSGLFMDTVTFQERVHAAASADPAAARDADFVLFTVKTLQSEEAARLLAPNLKPHAIVISLQNGVDNVPRIRAASGINALPAVVYVAAALPEPGRVKHSGRGELISYGHAARNPYTREMMTRVIEETVAVARASGVRLPDTNFVEMGLKLAEALGDATSSTAQDLARGKRTEIDSLNGYVVRCGAALGLLTPVSSTLFALVKLIEETLEKRGCPAGTSQ